MKLGRRNRVRTSRKKSRIVCSFDIFHNLSLLSTYKDTEDSRKGFWILRIKVIYLDKMEKNKNVYYYCNGCFLLFQNS